MKTETENDDYRQALERLEIENHEMRKKLEQIQFGAACDVNEIEQRMESKGFGFNGNITINKGVQTDKEITNCSMEHNKSGFIDPYNCTASNTSGLDEFGMLMLKAAKEEVEQLRETNEKLMKLHAKNHMRKPRMQDQTTQTYDNLNHTEISTTLNSSFMTNNSVQTQKVCYVTFEF